MIKDEIVLLMYEKEKKEIYFIRKNQRKAPNSWAPMYVHMHVHTFERTVRACGGCTYYIELCLHRTTTEMHPPSLKIEGLSRIKTWKHCALCDRLKHRWEPRTRETREPSFCVTLAKKHLAKCTYKVKVYNTTILHDEDTIVKHSPSRM